MGKVGEARDELLRLIPDALGDLIPLDLISTAEEYGAILAQLGQYQGALKLLGAADVMRERNGYLRHQWLEARIEDAYASSRKALAPQEWEDHYQAGRKSSIKALLEVGAPMTNAASRQPSGREQLPE